MHTLKLFISILIIGLFPWKLQAQIADSTKHHYHEFDFWLGKWKVYKYGTSQQVGSSHIESIIDSVGVLENYKSLPSTYQGKSLNKYNPQLKLWEQFWIDNGGLTLHLQGGLTDGKMILQDLNGLKQNRIVWEAITTDSVRQTWYISSDGGQSWQTSFDGLYKADN